MTPFIHLHNHTQYSLLDGAIPLKKLIETAAKMGMPALAMTDHGNIFGAIHFYEMAQKAGLKPIIGCEVYLAPHSRFADKEKQEGRSEEEVATTSHHLLLLVKDEEGYKNLLKLISASYLEGFYYKPRVDKELLRKYSAGLICLSGCLKSELARLILKEDLKKAFSVAGEYNEIFGPGNFYLELHHHHLEEELLVNEELLKLSKNLNIPIVATNDCHYLKKEEAKAHEVLLCIQTKSTLADPKRMKFSSDEFYFKSPEEMEFLFREVPEALKNTLEIARRCNLKLEFGKPNLPLYPLGRGESISKYLEDLCWKGLRKRYPPERQDQATQRLKHELAVVRKLGYEGYFLIIWDIVKFAKERNIPVGPGRGSAAGSIISYLLGISSLDPLYYGLIFERFLNPERVSMPDIDLDFCYERREEVIEYVKKRYGQEKVCQIITFGTMAARAVVRDVGRVLGIPYSEVDKIAKLIPPRGDITIEEALRIEPALRELQKKPEIRNLLEIARSLEGLTRHASMHAAGIVIGREELTNYLPLYLAKQSPNQEERIITTQFDMQAIEKIGLLKIDLLGLKTLSVIRKTIEQIKERTGREIKIEEVPLEDSQTYETLSRGETAGIFQLESAGMRDLLRKLKPEKIEDLIALLALYRPGTLQGGYVDSFIKRKHKKAEIKYLVPQLEEILKETYGVIIYQEQVMKIAHQLGGFSYGEADILRKAMGKKNPEVMEKQRQKFIEGAVKNNIPRDKAEEVFKLMAHFSGYGFVKAHSAAYALISYQTAYLKTHFPQEFMAALLTSEIGNTSQIALYVNECRKMGIKVLPPDVNTSYAHFSITFEGISFGLQAVKNVGAGAIESIIQAREKHGPFKSLDDFCQWVDLRMVNRRVIESLIKCGAFDSFNKPRAQLFIELDETLKKAERVQKERKQAQISLFELWKVEQKEKKKEVEKKIPEWPESELLSLEKEMLGLYISRHPLSKFEREIKNYASTSTQKLKELSDKEEVSVAGIITEMKQITDKKNRKMAFLTLEDLEGSVEVVVFADLFEKVSRYIFEDAAVLIRGRVSLSERNAKIMASDIIPLAEIKRKATRAIRIKFFTTGLEEEILNNLQEILSSHPGKCPVYLDFISSLGEEVEIIPSSAFYVNPSEELLLELNQLVGEDKVQVVL